jgi:hypothetical protein
MTLGEADEAGAHLKRACAAARSANMRIFIHTHGNEFTRAGDSTPLDRMLKSAGNCFDTQADISWVKWAGANPAAFIRRYGAKVTSLHVKDIAATAVGREFGSFGPESFTIVGQGAVDWADVMRAALRPTCDTTSSKTNRLIPRSRFRTRSNISTKYVSDAISTGRLVPKHPLSAFRPTSRLMPRETPGKQALITFTRNGSGHVATLGSACRIGRQQHRHASSRAARSDRESRLVATRREPWGNY